jgi:hypothetical protein
MCETPAFSFRPTYLPAPVIMIPAGQRICLKFFTAESFRDRADAIDGRIRGNS